MKMLLQGGRVYTQGKLQAADVLVENGAVAALGANLASPGGAEVLDCTGCVIAPGFTDLHVHLREPGYTHKETIATGTAAAAAGGFTTVCAMPNLDPVPDDLQNLAPQLTAIEKHALVRVLPYAALTVGEKGGCPADIAVLAGSVAGFSDDGRGVQSEEMMRRVMKAVAEAGSLVAAHCEVESLLPTDEGAATVQAGSAFAAQHGYVGCSNESEYAEVKRDIEIAADTGCRLHICHTSTAESFALVRDAKMEAKPVTCEVTPHNLLLSCEDISEDDGRFKMNPPLRNETDRLAAIDAVLDGTADAIATDHAPHAPEEKSGGFAKSMNGVVGLETAFASLYTGLVKPGTLPLEKLLGLFCEGPRRVLGIGQNPLQEGGEADLVVLDLSTTRTVDPDGFATKGRSTPFKGWQLCGWPRLTLASGREVYRRK